MATVVPRSVTEKWRVAELIVAMIRGDIDEIAARIGPTILEWWEDGWGEMRGFGGRLASGELLLVQKAQYSSALMLALDIYDVAERGTQPLLSEVLAGLDIPMTDVAVVTGIDQQARELLAKWNSQVALKKK